MSDPRSHPSRDQLAAFAHGQLSEDELRSLETHVAHCETCCDELRRVPHDRLVEQLRSSTSPLANAAVPRSDEAEAGELSPLANHPRYQIVRELGKGGMGVVYLAEHRVMGRLVALKVINPRLLRNQMAIERFRQEVQSAARLNHRNIVTAFDAEQAGDLHFLVMEYVDGTDLATTVSRRGPLPVLHACNYAVQAALGLQHAHEQGMVHRDIKPQNLMRTRKGTIKILDFGLARLAGSPENSAGLTAEGMTLGTPDYMAPEQARDARRADIRSDIYSLGCTLYFLLTGKVPYPTGTAIEKVVAHCTDDPVPIRSLRSELPDPLVRVLEKMMAKDPAARFQTPAEVAAALRPFGQPGEPPPSPTVSESAVLDEPDTPAAQTRFDSFRILAEPDGDDGDSFLEPAPNEASVPAPWPVAKPAGTSEALWKRWRLPLAGIVVAVIIGLGISNKPGQTNRAPIAGNSDPSPIAANGSGGPGLESNSTSAGDGWIDLIARVDPSRDPAAGAWRHSGGELTVESAEWARIALPCTPPEEYDLEVDFTRRSGTLSIAVIFSAGSGQATFELDAWGTHLAGLQLIDGQSLRDQDSARTLALVNGRRYTARVEVRRGSVRALLDDRIVASYRGDGSDLRPLELWRPSPTAKLGVGAYNSHAAFHRIRIRPRS